MKRTAPTHRLFVLLALGAAACSADSGGSQGAPMLEVSRAELTCGETATLTPRFEAGVARLEPGVGPVASGVAVAVRPSADTVYTLRVTRPDGTVRTAVSRVFVSPAPSIVTFRAARATITLGEETTLLVEFEGLDGEVDQGVGPVGNETELVVQPEKTMTYTLTARNRAGAVIQSAVTVTVLPPPRITSLQPTTAVITAGEQTSLTAFFESGTGVVLPDVGEVRSGTAIPVSPRATQVYTLIVTNPAGMQAVERTTVTVASAPTIQGFAASPGEITDGGPTTLTAVFSGGAGSVTGIGAVESFQPKVITPGSSQVYTLTVTNIAGRSVTADVRVSVYRPARVARFLAETPTVATGTAGRLVAEFSDGVGTIDNGIGTVQSGKVAETPSFEDTLGFDMPYTLTVTNPASSDTVARVSLTVVGPTIGCAGGTARIVHPQSALRGTRVVVPDQGSGCAPSALSVSRESLPGVLPHGATEAGAPLSFRRDAGGEPSEAVSITIPYQPSKTGDSGLAVFFWNPEETRWEQVPVESVDGNAHLVTFRSTRLGIFAPMRLAQ